MSAVITASGQPNEGQSYSLTCEVRGDENLAPTEQRFRWDEVGVSSGISRVATLTFGPLRPDDAGEYRCTSTFSSPYLTDSRTVTQKRTLTVNCEIRTAVCDLVKLCADDPQLCLAQSLTSD